MEKLQADRDLKAFSTSIFKSSLDFNQSTFCFLPPYQPLSFNLFDTFCHRLLQSPTKTHNFHLPTAVEPFENRTEKKTHKFHLKINFQGDFVNPFLSLFAAVAFGSSNQFAKCRWGKRGEMKVNDWNKCSRLKLVQEKGRRGHSHLQR